MKTHGYLLALAVLCGSASSYGQVFHMCSNAPGTIKFERDSWFKGMPPQDGEAMSTDRWLVNGKLVDSMSYIHHGDKVDWKVLKQPTFVSQETVLMTVSQTDKRPTLTYAHVVLERTDGQVLAPDFPTTKLDDYVLCRHIYPTSFPPSMPPRP